MVTENPRAWRSLARDAEMIPFPKDDVTPPVTNMYFVAAIFTISKNSYKIMNNNAIKTEKPDKDFPYTSKR